MIFAYLLLYACLLCYGASKLGIGTEEAKIVFTNPLFHALYRIWPHELFIRAPNIALTLLDVYLYYLYAKSMLKKHDAFFTALLFSALPAIIASGVIINKAPLILALTLLFLFFYQKYPIGSYIFAAALLFIDKSFAILFLGLFFYTLYKRRYEAIFFLGLFIASISLFGFDVGGKPKNYFFDIFAIFAAIFSPLLFLYYFYTIYRILIKERKDILFFISATAFLFSLALSFRQRVLLIDFAPFAVLGVALMVRTYLRSLRVRLRKHQRKLRLYFWIVMATLLFNDFVLVCNDKLFLFIPPQRHFALKHYVGKVLARELKRRSIRCIAAKGAIWQQLRFYGIHYCSDFLLSFKPLQGSLPIPLFIQGKYVTTYYVRKSNKKRGLR